MPTKPRLRFKNPNLTTGIQTSTNYPIMPPPKLRPRGKNTGNRTNKKKKKKTSPSKLSLSQTLAAKENEPPTDTLVAHDSSPASKRRKTSNPYLTIPTPKNQSSSTNIKSILLGIKHYNTITTPDNQSILASSSLPHTSKHEGLICSVLEDYVQCLASYKKTINGKIYLPTSHLMVQAPTKLPLVSSSRSEEQKTTINFNLPIILSSTGWLQRRRKRRNQKGEDQRERETEGSVPRRQRRKRI